MQDDMAVHSEDAGNGAQRLHPFDARVVSFPKMGRTLLCRMYFFYCCQAVGEDNPLSAALVEQRRVHDRPTDDPRFGQMLAQARDCGKALPHLQFIHPATRSSKKEELTDEKALRISRGRVYLFVVRDPRDTVVSYFHHLNSYKGASTMRLKDGTVVAVEKELSRFIKDDSFGVPAIVGYLNHILAAVAKGDFDYRVLTFEEMRRDREEALRRLLRFAGSETIYEEAVHFAVEETDFASTQAREIEDLSRKPNKFPEVSTNMLRARKGAVGGYKEELSPEDVAWINAYMERNLPKVILDMYPASH